MGGYRIWDGNFARCIPPQIAGGGRSRGREDVTILREGLALEPEREKRKGGRGGGDNGVEGVFWMALTDRMRGGDELSVHIFVGCCSVRHDEHIDPRILGNRISGVVYDHLPIRE